MIEYSDVGIGPPNGAASHAQARESLRGSGFMYKVTIDIQDSGFSGNFTHSVRFPDFLKHCFWFWLLLLHFQLPSR